MRARRGGEVNLLLQAYLVEVIFVFTSRMLYVDIASKLAVEDLRLKFNSSLDAFGDQIVGRRTGDVNTTANDAATSTSVPASHSTVPTTPANYAPTGWNATPVRVASAHHPETALPSATQAKATNVSPATASNAQSAPIGSLRANSVATGINAQPLSEQAEPRPSSHSLAAHEASPFTSTIPIPSSRSTEFSQAGQFDDTASTRAVYGSPGRAAEKVV